MATIQAKIINLTLRQILFGGNGNIRSPYYKVCLCFFFVKFYTPIFKLCCIIYIVGDSVKNKGIVLSGLIYALLVFFLLLLASLMFILQFRQLSINKLKKDSVAIYDQYIYTYGYTGKEQTFTAPKTGKYYVQLWGASATWGRGGYTSGYINLNKDEQFFIYVGQAMTSVFNSTTFNGGTGSADGYPGGGATDIRVYPIKKYRYVRDYLNGNSSEVWSHWVEIQVYDRYGNIISLNKPVVGSFVSSTLNLVTNNDLTAANNVGAGPGEQWVEIDLGSEYEISMVKTYHYYTDGRSYYGTKTQVISADRSLVDTLYDSALTGTYAETSAGKIHTDLSLRSRIMVAGGAGAGGDSMNNSYGGGLTGGAGLANAGATQTAAGATSYTIAGFGFGGGGCGGGGGYYGGGGATCANGGSGGSSFISGYAGSDAVNAYGVHTGQPNHYSGYIFTDARTVAGNASMPSITGTTEVGHVGNGYAIIKYVE